MGDLGSMPGLGRSPGEGNGNSLQYSRLANAMDRGAQQGIVHRVAKSWTGLSDKHVHFRYTVKSGIIVLSSLLIKLRHRGKK